MELTEFTGEALMEIRVRPVERSEEAQYQDQMARHHYLGALAKIGETVWYVAIWREQWLAQLSLSAAALIGGVRDHIKSFQKPAQSIPEIMRKRTFRTRLVFDYLRMSQNAIPRSSAN